MKLLLDEMYPPSIATGLRDRGHDAIAVVERPELRALSDTDVFAFAQGDERVVVTENVRDFAPLADARDASGQPHRGLVLVHPAKYPRGNARTVGKMVRALGALAAPVSLRAWL